MVTLTNYSSGELEIADGAGHALRLDRETANRLIMHARMHAVAEFVERLPSLVGDSALVGSILEGFEKMSSTDRWNLKEKFARLRTLAKDYQPARGNEMVEEVSLGQ